MRLYTRYDGGPAILAWTVATHTPVAHAQGPGQHTVVLLKSAYYLDGKEAEFEKALNNAAKGGELVALVPTIQQAGQFTEYMAVFRKR